MMKCKVMQNRILYLLCIVLSGCAAVVTGPPSNPPDMILEKKELPAERSRSRELASLHLTEQGRILLESGKVDDAISVLERAVSIYSSNGKNYYYLAEAWLKKGNVLQAGELNRLAEMYLADDREWLQRVYGQSERVRSRGW